MKKLIGLALLAILTLPLFSKEIPLKVTETEWGFEISNINDKGKIICKDSLKLDDKFQSQMLIILKKSTDSFSIDNLIQQITEKDLFNKINPPNLSGYRSAKDLILTINGTSFENAEKIQYEKISDYESVIVVPYGYCITNFKTYCDRNDLNLQILNVDYKQKTKLISLIEQKKIEKENAVTQKKLEQQKIENEKKAHLKELYLKANKEGFDSMPWGTPKEEVLNIYPNAKKIEKQEPFEVYQIKKETSGAEMTYLFYEDKLIMGETIYPIKTATQNEDIINRLKELYGKPTDSKDLTEHKSENVFGTYISFTDYDIRAIWNKSPTFKIVSATTARIIDGGGADQALLGSGFINTITYTNEKLVNEIKQNIEKQKKAEEEKAKRERMNNLDL